jgi:hypothetical protein
MVEDAFQQADDVAALEDRVHDVILGAFTAADEVHVDYAGNSNSEHDVDDTGLEEPLGECDTTEAAENHSFDPQALEEVIWSLYRDAQYT